MMRRRYRRKRRWRSSRGFSTQSPPLDLPVFQESAVIASLRARVNELSAQLTAFSSKRDRYVLYVVNSVWLGVVYLSFPDSFSKRNPLGNYLMGWGVAWVLSFAAISALTGWLLQVLGLAAKERAKQETLANLEKEIDKTLGQERAKWDEQISNLKKTAELENKRRLDEKRRKELQIDALDPFEFEKMLGDKFQQLGYEVRLTSKTGDGGVDLWLKMRNKKIAIQCKRYAKDSAVSRPDIQRFIGALITEKADEGVFITTSFFTDGAKKAAKASPYQIKLMEREEVFSFLGL